MTRNPLLSIALLLASAPALAGDVPEHPLPPEPPHVPAITAEEFLWQAAWLSDDARAGRDTDSEGGRAAAAWIAGRMKAMGLEAPEGAPGFLRSWGYRTTIVKEECVLEVAREGGKPRPFAAGTDWVHLGGIAKGDIEAPAVFAGYGIAAPKLGYDDFRDLDCKGKVVVALRHEPREKDAKSRWNGDRASPHSSFFAKAAAAAAAGAAALVVVNDPLNHATDNLDMAGTGAYPIPVLLASRGFAEEVLGGPGDALPALQKSIDDADAPVAAKTGGAGVRLRIVTRERRPDNVCGILRGADPALRDEWVVVGAHYDHVGLGQGGGPDPRSIGQIHNGADDNASGTASMLEVAESFALGKARPRRSLLFLAFSGEEKGLLGSAAWVKDPLVPLDRIVAMINLDMVGRYRPGMLDVVAAESGSTLKEAVDRSAEGLGLEYRHTNEGIRDSDGWNFFQAKIPTLFLFTGLHEEYHRPPDDWWLLNAAGAAKIAEWSARTVRRLADADGRPAFVPVTPRPLNRGNRVVLGVNLSDAPGGMGAVVDGVSPRSAAERAGVRAGDRIVSLGGREVKDADGLRSALNHSKPGDIVVAKVVRGTEALDLPVTFGGRSGPVFGVVFDAGRDGARGALVQEVAAGSVAEAAGLKPGDRIVSFGGKEVPDASALPEALRTAKAGDRVKIRVIRESKELELEAAYPAAK